MYVLYMYVCVYMYVLIELNWFLKGSCLSSIALYYWKNVHWDFRYAITDFGVIALALLANDRYQSLKDPMEYLANSDNVNHPRHAFYAAILALMTNGLEVLVQCEFIQFKLKWSLVASVLFPLSQLIRAVYLFVCTYM